MVIADYSGKYKTDIIAALMRADHKEDYIVKIFNVLGLADKEYVLDTIKRIEDLL